MSGSKRGSASANKRGPQKKKKPSGREFVGAAKQIPADKFRKFAETLRENHGWELLERNKSPRDKNIKDDFHLFPPNSGYHKVTERDKMKDLDQYIKNNVDKMMIKNVDYFGNTGSSRQKLLKYLLCTSTRENIYCNFMLKHDGFVIVKLSEQERKFCDEVRAKFEYKRTELCNFNCSEALMKKARSTKKKRTKKVHWRALAEKDEDKNHPAWHVWSDQKRTIARIDPADCEAFEGRNELDALLNDLLNNDNEEGFGIKKLSTLRTYPGARRQQFHTDFPDGSSNSVFFFVVPYEKESSLFVRLTTDREANDIEKEVKIPAYHMLIGAGNLVHAGSTKTGLRLHGYVSSAANSQVVNDTEVLFHKDENFPNPPNSKMSVYTKH